MRSLGFTLLLTLLSLPASASTFYVDDSGSDSNPGTITQPFRHIQHAIDQIDSPGDVVYVRAGTYNEEILIWDKHGTSTDWIWILNYNSEPVTITGAGLTRRTRSWPSTSLRTSSSWASR